MKLWYSTFSPYARKAIVVLRHHGLDAQVDLLQTPAAFDPAAPHNADTPLGRVPALQTDAGDWLFGSSLIADYLDDLGQGQSLALDGANRWQARNLTAIAEGIMENATPVVVERVRRDQADWWTDRQDQLLDRCHRTFAVLHDRVADFSSDLNLATITLVCLIDWWQLRSPVLGFSLDTDFPDLVNWAKAMNDRYPVLKESWKP